MYIIYLRIKNMCTNTYKTQINHMVLRAVLGKHRSFHVQFKGTEVSCWDGLLVPSIKEVMPCVNDVVLYVFKSKNLLKN